MLDFLCIGEPLAEFTNDPATPDLFHRRLGGDTLNAAIYLARLRPDLRVGYLSRLGEDGMSRWMRETIAREGVEVEGIAAEPTGSPGLSFIATDATGERSFTYWRDQAPARRMFGTDGTEVAALGQARVLLLSGITLAILPVEARARLLAELDALRQRGVTVAYDTNYRPRLWRDRAEAAEWTERALAVTSLALPSLDDLAALWEEVDPEAVMARCETHAPGMVVLTTGGGAVLARDASGAALQVALPAPVAAVDTTAAGDSFDAALLSALQRGKPLEAAILDGARLASCVVCYPGAIIPRDAMKEEVAHHAA